MSQSDACFGGDTVLSVEQAREQLLASVRPLATTEKVGLAQALGRVLAADVISPLDVPGYDNSAMDGYAVRSGETRDGGRTLPVSQRIAAGHPGSALTPGSAARIFTGAPMPAGADAVVMQEQCRAAGDSVYIERRVRPGENVRPRANDIAQGSRVLTAGEKLSPQAVGLLASLGVAEVEVVRRVRVALLNTGDEIIEPGQPLAAGQIYNSNRYTLIAVLQQIGCELVDLGQVQDTFEATRTALRRGAATADLILSSGGVSVGEEDHIKAALQADGELDLWRVRMKPGKPLAFGHLGDTPFVGLPGNPVSAFVTFCLFAMPLLRVLQGRSGAFPLPQRVCLPRAIEQPLKRREYVRVRLEHPAERLPQADLFPRQGSEVLTSTVWADGLLELPEGVVQAADSPVNYWSFECLLA